MSFQTLRASLVLALLAATSPLAAQESSPANAAGPAGGKPNVLFIAVDDLNHWVGYLGRNNQTRTPNLDRLAARGVAFSRAYCAAPSCNPSRAALMSGLRPSSSGVYDNGNDWRTVIPADKCLPATFRKAGYVAYGAGKIYHGSWDRKDEWNEYMQSEGGYPKPTGSDGVGGIKFAPLDCKDEDIPDYRIANYTIEKLGQKHDKPFFLSCGFHKPHMPWNVPQKWFDMFPLDQIKLPPHIEGDLKDVPPAGLKMARPEGDHAAMVKSGRWKEAVQAYLATIAYLDMNVGRVLDALDKGPHKDNTIIVLWGDHGWHLGEKEHWRKFALWEEATRAPLIWVAPGVTKSGVCDRPVDFMSIYPTLTDLCGIETPAHVEGKSIRPLLTNPKADWATPALTTYKFNNHAIRTEGWRYIRYADGGEELYDESADPLEHNNVAGNTEHAARKAEMAKAMPTKNTPDIGGAGAAAGKPRAGAARRKKQAPQE